MYLSLVFVSAILVIGGNAQKKACDPLDDGPYLGTNPTLSFMVPEATAADIQSAESSGLKKYYSELRVFGDFSAGDFNVTVYGDFLDPFEYFVVVGDSGKTYLKLDKPIDRDGPTSSLSDDVSYISFTLTCTPGNSSIPEVVYDGRIFITDVNDNVPEFPVGNITLNITVNEATPVGTVLFIAEADDKDENMDRNITYQILNHKDMFAIDSITGAVTLTSELDYESLPSDKVLDLILTVEDGGPIIINTVTTTATLHVQDADDQNPAFIYQGCFTYKNVCAWPKYTAGRKLIKDQPIQVLPVPNKGQGTVTIKAADLDVGVGNKVKFSIVSTIPPGSEASFRVDTTSLGNNEYQASVVSLKDMTVNEGFEIFLAATEESVSMKHEVAMILFTEGASTETDKTTTTDASGTAGQGSNNNNTKGDDDDAGYSKLEVALIVVVAILAAFLLCACVALIFAWRRNSYKKWKTSSPGHSNNGFTDRL